MAKVVFKETPSVLVVPMVATVTNKVAKAASPSVAKEAASRLALVTKALVAKVASRVTVLGASRVMALARPSQALALEANRAILMAPSKVVALAVSRANRVPHVVALAGSSLLEIHMANRVLPRVALAGSSLLEIHMAPKAEGAKVEATVSLVVAVALLLMAVVLPVVREATLEVGRPTLVIQPSSSSESKAFSL